MSGKAKLLFDFDVTYYHYPTSISRGYWGRYPLATGLSEDEVQRRTEWLNAAKSWRRSRFHIFVWKTFAQSSDHNLLKELVSKHGIFVERFFHHAIRERVAATYAKTGVDLSTFTELLSEAWGYQVYVSKGEPDAIFRVVDHIYEQILIYLLDSTGEIAMLQDWFERYRYPRECMLCGNTFRVVDLPDWLYFGSNGCTDCCFNCRIVSNPRKSELMDLLPKFVEACGFIPRSDCHPTVYSFSSRLQPNRKIDAYKRYAQIGGVEHVEKKFGSWFTALVATKVLPDGMYATARGVRCLALDGHVCHSLDEKLVDDWFTSHGISHEREPFYPIHQDLNPAGRRRADWKVGTIYFEYFGLAGDADYDAKCLQKILLAGKIGIEMIPIYPDDLNRLNEKLGFLL